MLPDCVYRTDGKVCLVDRKRECDSNKHCLSLQDPAFLNGYVDQLLIATKQTNPTPTHVLRNLLEGAPAFLACGGPSANDLPLEKLNRRGIFTLCVNNMAGHSKFRPQAFVCADPLTKFSASIWMDSAIMKFVPTVKLRGRRARLRQKVNGEFSRLNRDVNQCPNVWSYKRDNWMAPDETFFLGDGAKWGNLNSGVEKTGEPKTVCTMLLALRILYYLGARRIYLVGVDFHMSHDRGYSFPQARDRDAIQSNNEQFEIVGKWLGTMADKGVFQKFGLSVYNCYEHSGLRAFPYVPFDKAVDDAAGVVEECPDLAGWYEK